MTGVPGSFSTCPALPSTAAAASAAAMPKSAAKRRLTLSAWTGNLGQSVTEPTVSEDLLCSWTHQLKMPASTTVHRFMAVAAAKIEEVQWHPFVVCSSALICEAGTSWPSCKRR